MLLVSRCLRFANWKFATGAVCPTCSRPHRYHSSGVSRTLCSAPIKVSRQDVKSIQESKSKFPFGNRFELLRGEVYDSTQVIDGLGHLLTSKRLEGITKVTCIRGNVTAMCANHHSETGCLTFAECLQQVVNGRSFSVLPIVEGDQLLALQPCSAYCIRVKHQCCQMQSIQTINTFWICRIARHGQSGSCVQISRW